MGHSSGFLSRFPTPQYAYDIGDRIPPIFGRDQFGTPFSLRLASGRPRLILVLDACAEQDATELISSFHDFVLTHREQVTPLILLNADIAEKLRTLDVADGVAILSDSRKVIRELRAVRPVSAGSIDPRHPVFAVLTDPFLRIAAVQNITCPDDARVPFPHQSINTLIEHQSRIDPPVLIVPDLLTAEQCNALISLWRDDNSTGLITVGNSSETAHREDSSRICRDHQIKDPHLKETLQNTVGARVADTIARIFNANMSFFEDMLIVGYDAAAGGHFSAHRDNACPSLIHRQFALSLSLNSGTYRGGGVTFPEFSDRIYDPPLGAGLIFTCGLLHRALPVTQGERLILSGFLWSKESEDVRHKMAARSDSRAN
ncbi:MAG: 2OG-Fe(II) oxygenase [Pseudomonadota bacterium]